MGEEKDQHGSFSVSWRAPCRRPPRCRGREGEERSVPRKAGWAKSQNLKSPTAEVLLGAGSLRYAVWCSHVALYALVRVCGINCVLQGPNSAHAARLGVPTPQLRRSTSGRGGPLFALLQRYRLCRPPFASFTSHFIHVCCINGPPPGRPLSSRFGGCRPHRHQLPSRAPLPASTGHRFWLTPRLRAGHLDAH